MQHCTGCLEISIGQVKVALQMVKDLTAGSMHAEVLKCALVIGDVGGVGGGRGRSCRLFGGEEMAVEQSSEEEELLREGEDKWAQSGDVCF